MGNIPIIFVLSSVLYTAVDSFSFLAATCVRFVCVSVCLENVVGIQDVDRQLNVSN